MRQCLSSLPKRALPLSEGIVLLHDVDLHRHRLAVGLGDVRRGGLVLAGTAPDDGDLRPDGHKPRHAQPRYRY